MLIDQHVATFISNIGDTPLLTAVQEKELALIIKLNKNGKERDDAINKFVKANLKLVLKEAFSQSNKTGLDVKELISCGCVGLMKAVYNYKLKFKTRFSTYATLWIQQAIRDYMYRNTNPVQIPIHIINGLSKHRRLKDFSDQNEHNEKTDAEVMKKLNINKSFLDRIKKAYVTSVSLDQQIDAHDGKSSNKTFKDTIADENAVDPSKSMEDIDKYNDLYLAIDELDPMSKEIVTAQFLENDKVQLAKLGSKYGVTGERIRQVKAKALKLLKKKLERKAKYGK